MCSVSGTLCIDYNVNTRSIPLVSLLFHNTDPGQVVIISWLKSNEDDLPMGIRAAINGLDDDAECMQGSEVHMQAVMLSETSALGSRQRGDD